MYKIKLLILLLISFVLLSCTNNDNINKNNRFSLGYIGGGYDGLVMSNLIETYLKSYNMLDDNSELSIEIGYNNNANLYVSGIDKTSDRQKIISEIKIKIYNKMLDCYVYSFEESVSQFYIFATNEKFISNEKAVEKIKYENADLLTKRFINNVMYEKLICE